MKSIRVAIAGIGNCASSFVQTVYAAKAGAINENDPGLIHEELGGYRLSDIEFVAAFDVNQDKIHLDLSDAIFAKPNCTTRYVDVPHVGVRVSRAPVLDGISPRIQDLVRIDPYETAVDVAQVLRDTQAEVLVNLLPVGSSQAVHHFASAALAAQTAFVNCMPEPIATDPVWRGKFAQAGVPLLGDDMKSQLGATAVHRALIECCKKRGAQIDRTYQLNFGGNTDFLNMQENDRKLSKRRTKMNAVLAELDETTQVSVGPSDYVPFMQDHKTAYMRLEGRLLLGMKFSIELKLDVEDSPNAAGVIVDAVRVAKAALDKGKAGAIEPGCAFLFKNPPHQLVDDDALRQLNEFCR